ncbi:MAG: RND family transporter, partial [Hyphomicrobiales bacterium]
ANIEKLRDVVINLNFLTSMKGLVSLFSARQPPKPGVVPPALFPAELPTGEAYDEFIQKVRGNEIIKGKLLSDDGTLALIVLALDPKVVAGEGLGAAVDEIRKEFDALNDTGLRVRLSGAPVMQQEIRDAVEHDRLIYNGLGFALGTIIAIIFFRRVSLMVIAATPPIVAIFWSLGTFGLIEFKLNLFLNVMSPLVMVLGFSDSMQLTFAIRDRLIAGYSRREAIRYALLVVGPACVLSSATAAASFITLFASDSSLIRTFGAAGAISTLIAYIASIVLVPLIATFLLRDDGSLGERLKVRDPGISALKTLAGWIAVQTTRRPALFFTLGLICVVGFGSVYLSLSPRYRLADQVPDRQEAVAASSSLDLKLTGANPLEVMVEWPQGRALYDDEVIEVIGKVHKALETQKGVGNVWSVETLKRWLIESGDYSLAVLKEYIDVLPEHLVGRFINFKFHSALVSGRIPDIDASEILPVIEHLDRELQGVREAHPGFRIVATGLAAVAARNSASMIENLNTGLTIEMLFISACLGLVFRSALVAAVSLLPNLFPIFTAGAFLAATGAGLQFASIIALTIAFGLALNAAVHYFNRLRLEQKEGEDPALGVVRATVLIGPALMLTTMVLVIGLGVTIFSGLPSLRTFGELTALALVAGLIGDLFILPATILLAQRGLAFLRRNRRALTD